MKLFHLLSLSPATGDDSPQKNKIVWIILGVAVVVTLVLGLWKGKKK